MLLETLQRNRKPILITAAVLGLLALFGAALFAVAGAGIYGSPFDGDAWYNGTLLAVLLVGPVAILPCVVFDYLKPGRGGWLLCGLALVDVLAITLNNQCEWGFAIHAAGLATLGLTLPMVLLGTLLFLSANPDSGSLLVWIWRIEMILAGIIGIYFLWQVGWDGISALVHWLRGGTI